MQRPPQPPPVPMHMQMQQQQQQQQQQGSWDMGRVPGVGQHTGAPVPFQLFADGGPRNAGAFATDTLAHTASPTAVSTLFLSPANVDALQLGIRNLVYSRSGGRHRIGRQSDVELAIVMRSILLQEGRNLGPDTGATRDGPDSVLSQVRALNASVLAFCVPRIIGEADGYLRYRDEISTLPTPMEHGALATSKGDRSLVMPSFF
jgi:hypothetical protein